MTTGWTAEVSALVEFIVMNPGLSESLLRQHVDDGQGHCRACALGAQRGYHRFPCGIRSSAEHARQIESSRD
jgi:hypothetical protein